MISEYEARSFNRLCESLVDEPKILRVVTRFELIADAQTDPRLEFLLRTYINQDGEAASAACEELALYTEEMMLRIRCVDPAFDTDDMQLVLSGARARIEGMFYE